MISPLNARCFAVAWLAILSVAIGLAGCVGKEPAPEMLVKERCTKCHTLAPIEVSHKTYQQWETTVYRMKARGARLNSQETQAVIDYLSEVHGPEN